MKKLTIIFALTIITILSASSQENTRQERLEAFKVGFFTKRLNLTSSEAEKFWPVYNGFQQERAKIQMERQGLIRSFNQNQAKLSNAQIGEISDKMIDAVVKESELAVAFHAKLKEALPPAKVIRFYQAENQFRQFLLNELQNRPQPNRPMHGNDPSNLPDL